MDDNKKIARRINKEFLYEIIAGIVFTIAASLFLFDKNFAVTIITGFLKPEKALTFLLVLGCISALLVFLYFIQARNKRLKSTQKMSAFAKTVVCDHKVRAMSVTQVSYEQGHAITALKNHLPVADVGNPNIVELYFNNEADLNI